ncbi:hypothetical protein GF312_05525 [Candidatus Poribacteria bacterium]|nr:hypothetical protein [Candidatus Poribacteria bacterium]
MQKFITLIISFLMFFILCVSFIVAAEDVEIALEAELASKIQKPMVIALPIDAKDAGGVETDEPSGGKYVWAPGPPVTGGGGSGFMEFKVDIPQDDTYAIWGRVIAWDGNSDSFWVTWMPADPEENPQQTDNVEFRWGVAGGGTWHWDRINHWLDGGTFDREWELEKGESILKIWTREDATMLDCLFITNNLAANEGGANVRLPEDDEREEQEGNIAVEPLEKISTTWGSIKNQY